MAVAVLCYHRISPKDDGEAMPLDVFYWQMKFIKRFFNPLTADDLNEEKSKGVVITFDDGYVDNFIYAYPVLKKLGLKAVLFLATSRINKHTILRKTLFDYWDGKINFDELFIPSGMDKANEEFLKNGTSSEFLSYEEIYNMKDVFSIQSHTHFHVRHFCSHKLIGFYNPSLKIKHSWSLPYALEEEKLFYGLPIFPMRSVVSSRRFFVKDEVKRVAAGFAEDVSLKNNWQRELREVMNNFSSLGHYETEEKRIKRTEEELSKSKKIIESSFNSRVNHLSWPFGEYDDIAVRLAKKTGYKFCYTTEKGCFSSHSNPLFVPRIHPHKKKLIFARQLITYSSSLFTRINKKIKPFS